MLLLYIPFNPHLSPHAGRDNDCLLFCYTHSIRPAVWLSDAVDALAGRGPAHD